MRREKKHQAPSAHPSGKSRIDVKTLGLVISSGLRQRSRNFDI
jgi:hypothetical protein